MLLLRLSVLGKGALGSSDEGRYLQSFNALRAAAHGNWQACAYALSMTDARPLDALWRCVPAAGQLALSHWAGLSIYTYPSLLVPTVLNWATTVLTAGFFFALCRRLFHRRAAGLQWALVAAILYAGLVNTSLEVRHVSPYDGALLLFMGLLYWVLRQPVATGAWFWLRLGLGAGGVWLLYPGYYAAPVLLVLPLLSWRHPLAWVRNHLFRGLILGVGFALPLLVAEALSRYGGGPRFWAISYDLSLHILQGDPAEGYTYLFSYLWQVETGLGVVLGALLGLALVQLVPHVRRGGLAVLIPRTPLQKILLAALLLFLLHATAAAVGHRIVWYGRLLRLYLPFIVLAGVAALSAVRWPRVAPAVALSSCAVAVVCYALFLRTYARLVYPADVITTFKLNCLPADKVLYYNEVKAANKSLGAIREVRKVSAASCPPNHGDSLTILVNFGHLYPLAAADWHPMPALGPGARVVFNAPLDRSFPAYEFEGLRPAERAVAKGKQFRLYIIRVACLPAITMNGLLLR